VLTILSDMTPASAVFLAVGSYAGLSIPVLLLPDAHRSDFDPRPALTSVWQAAVDAGHTANRGIALAELHAKQTRDRARLAAVSGLLLLVTHLDPTPAASKKGATHV
jgi:hypothetical protein